MKNYPNIDRSNPKYLVFSEEKTELPKEDWKKLDVETPRNKEIKE